MFTGIIEDLGSIKDISESDGNRRFTIECSFAGQLSIDQSININGVCHTVTGAGDKSFTVQSVKETMRKTAVGELETGMRVNLERSVTPDRRLDGHIVQGHVDTVGTIDRVEQEGTDRLFSIRYPDMYGNLVVGRGSIAVDGVSLTVSRDDPGLFTVAIIPYTYDHTRFRNRSEGDSVNLEFDILGKYVAKYMEGRE